MTRHWPWASFPLIHGSRGLHCHLSPLKDIVCKLRWRCYFLFRNDKTISIIIKYTPLTFRIGGDQKRSEQSLNANHKSLETMYIIAILSPIGLQTASENNFVSNDFYLRSSIKLTFMIAVYPVCLLINWKRRQDNLKQGLGVIYIFHVSVSKLI